VLDVATGTNVDGPIDRARYSPVAWLPGGSAFYYVRRLPPRGLPENEHQYHRRIWLHQLGTDPATDVEIFGTGRDPRSYYGVGVSREGRWLIVCSLGPGLAATPGRQLGDPANRLTERGAVCRPPLRR
jgi:prolyl oligopeptidase